MPVPIVDHTSDLRAYGAAMPRLPLPGMSCGLSAALLSCAMLLVPIGTVEAALGKGGGKPQKKSIFKRIASKLKRPTRPRAGNERLRTNANQALRPARANPNVRGSSTQAPPISGNRGTVKSNRPVGRPTGVDRVSNRGGASSSQAASGSQWSRPIGTGNQRTHEYGRIPNLPQRNAPEPIYASAAFLRPGWNRSAASSSGSAAGQGNYGRVPGANRGAVRGVPSNYAQIPPLRPPSAYAQIPPVKPPSAYGSVPPAARPQRLFVRRVSDLSAPAAAKPPIQRAKSAPAQQLAGRRPINRRPNSPNYGRVPSQATLQRLANATPAVGTPAANLSPTAVKRSASDGQYMRLPPPPPGSGGVDAGLIRSRSTGSIVSTRK